MLGLFCWWFNAYPYTLGAKHLNVFCKMMNNSISMWFSINENSLRPKLRNKYLIERNPYGDNFHRNFVTMLSNFWPCFCKYFMLQPILVTTLSKDCVETADWKARRGACRLSGRGLCAGLVTSVEKPHRVCCVWVSTRSLDTEEVLAYLWLSDYGWREKYVGKKRVNRETWYFSNVP